MVEINFGGLVGQTQRTSDLATQQLAGDFDDFLTLLTTQLQNQDPLEPMDATEFTNQLVAFAEVEQQINSNEKLETLSDLTSANVFSSALGYVGMDISYLGGEMYYDGATPANMSYSLEGQAAQVRLFVRDASGQVVRSVDLPASELGGRLTWDGTYDNGDQAEAGAYTVTVDALTEAGDPVGATTYVGGRVRGLEMQGTTMTAIVGNQAVPVGNIVGAQAPAAQQTAS